MLHKKELEGGVGDTPAPLFCARLTRVVGYLRRRGTGLAWLTGLFTVKTV